MPDLTTPTTPRLARATAAWLVWDEVTARLVRVERLGSRLMAVDVPEWIPDRQGTINRTISAVEVSDV